MVNQNTLRACKVFSDFFFKFATAVDKTKCLEQIKLPISIHACATISDLPPHTGTMVSTDKMIYAGESLFFFLHFYDKRYSFLHLKPQYRNNSGIFYFE